jgi:hypothetical protein
MQPASLLGTHAALPFLRWGARILSIPILLFWGFMLVAHIFGDEGRSTRPLVWTDTAILTTVLLSLAGLAVAWKWELAGGALSLAAVTACAVINLGVLAFPATLIPITAVMFLASGLPSRPPRRHVSHA